MKLIVPITIVAVWLLQLSGSLTSSVGGPMTIAFVFFIAMLAVGIYEAWSNRRGPLAWIVNIVVAVIGGFLVAMVAGFGMDVLLSNIRLEGSLVSSNHPLFYILMAVMATITLLGSWLAIQTVNRFR